MEEAANSSSEPNVQSDSAFIKFESIMSQDILDSPGVFVPVEIEEIDPAAVNHLNMGEFVEAQAIQIDKLPEHLVAPNQYIEYNQQDEAMFDLDEQNALSIEEENLLTNQFLNGELTFAEFTIRMDQDTDIEMEEAETGDAININTESQVNDGASIKKLEKPARARHKRSRKNLPAALQGLMGEANLRYARGEVELATKMCMEIIRQVPNAPEPFQTLSMIYENDQPDKSLQFALIAAHLSPRDSDQWVRLANASLESGNLRQALTCYSKAIQVSPKNIELYELRAALQDQHGDKKAYIRAYSKLLHHLGPEDGQNIMKYSKLLAQCCMKENMYEIALVGMDHLFKKCPQLVTLEEVNIMTELLIGLKHFNRCLDVLITFTPVSIEYKESGIVDSTEGFPTKALTISYCNIPDDLAVDLKAKCIISLIELDEIPIVDLLTPRFQELENPEISGDLFLDVAESFMNKKKYDRALKLLEPLVNSENFSLAAVWLRHAECWEGCHDMNKAIKSFEIVRKLSPQHLGARMELAKLYKLKGQFNKAILVLKQDPETDILDPGIIYERTKLLLKVRRYSEYFKSGMLLFSRHCITLRSKLESTALSKTSGSRQRVDILQRDRLSRGEPLQDDNLPSFSTNNQPTEKQEFLLLLQMCRIACKLKKYGLLQRMCFTALTSKRFVTENSHIMYLCLLSCIRNNDSFAGFNIVREMVRSRKKSKAWNLLNIIIQQAEDSRHNRFLMRQLGKEDAFSYLHILHANNCLVSGTYKYALNDYISLFKVKPNALIALLVSVTLLQMACQSFLRRKINLWFNMDKTLDSKIEFRHLCNLFEKISKSKQPKKYEELKKFVRDCRALANKVKAENQDADVSLYPIFRLIMPTLERERGPYGLKGKALTGLYLRVFAIGKNSDNAKKLMNYKMPLNDSSKTDDFAERVYWVLRNRLKADQSTLTIHEVNEFLDNTAKCHETNKSKDQLFTIFMREIGATELKWLTRILLKDLRLGLAQKKIFEVIHPEAEELFNVTSSLRRVCERFAESNSEEADRPIGVEIFSHVKPMLLERFKIENIGKLFADEQKYFVQPKFDGERSQLHMRDGKFKYFTRQGYDITGNTSYGETTDSGGFLTSNISKLLNRDCRSIILDGEMMGWHKTKKSFGSKGLNYDVKKLSEKSQHQPCFVAYDILYYNDELLIGKPYSERLEYLQSAFSEKEGILVLSKTETVSKKEQIVEIFNKSLDNDDEGIVLKKPDTLYRPNVREKSGCYKIKAEYSDGLVNDLDLIILGGYYGQGRHSGQVNSFLVGIASPPRNKKGTPSEFFALVSVGTGLKDDDLKMIQQKFKHLWKDKKPAGVFGPNIQPPNVWISPKDSIILQLRASEITRTRNYPFGYTLRFSRVMCMRLDKPWYDACSTDEFLALVKDKSAIQKLTKRKVTAHDIDYDDEEVMPKIRKIGPKSTTVHPAFLSTQNQEVPRLSRLFWNKEFCIINGNDEFDKNAITKILKEHMAKVVQNPGKNTFCVLVGNPDTLRAQNVIESEKYDVVNLDWLKRATRPENYRKIEEFYPWELYSASLSTIKRLQDTYDNYSDHFTKDVNEDDLKRIMKITGEKIVGVEIEFPIQEMKKLDRILFGGETSPFSVLRGISGYFHDKQDSKRFSFEFMGGILLENFDADYIFVDSDIDINTIDKYKVQFQENKKSTTILKNKWIDDCFKDQRLLPIEIYVI